jgi:hypothetical protein
MNPDTQLLLAEIQKLAATQTETQKQLADQGALLERRFLEADEVLEQRFKDAESAVEQRIIDSELRQDTRLVNIEKAAGDLQSWRQEQEGVIDDLRLRLTKLDKYWNRSIADKRHRASTLQRAAGEIGAARRDIICGLYGCSAEWAPHRQPPPGGWVWGGHHPCSFPGHGYGQFH